MHACGRHRGARVVGDAAGTQPCPCGRHPIKNGSAGRKGLRYHLLFDYEEGNLQEQAHMLPNKLSKNRAIKGAGG